MYLVTASVAAGAPINAERTRFKEWQANESMIVEDGIVWWYQLHSDVFTVDTVPANTEEIYSVAHEVTADDVTAGSIDFSVGFAPGAFVVQVLDANGLMRAVTDLITVDGSTITVTLDGDTNCVATDVITIIATS